MTASGVQAGRAASQLAKRSGAARWFVRGGWLALAVVYLALAWIVGQTAVGGSAQEANTTGALQYIGNTPAGGLALIVVGIGLLAFAVGRVLEVTMLAGAGIDTRERLKALLLAALHTALAASAFAIGDPGGPEGTRGEQAWSTFLFNLPAGRYIVGVLGVVLAALGVRAVAHGIGRRYMRTLDTATMTPRIRSAVERVGLVAYLTRGMLYGLLGFFFARAAFRYQPRQAKGLDGALHEVASAPWGQVLLFVVAAGMLAYAVFCLLQARYRNVGVSAGGTA